MTRPVLVTGGAGFIGVPTVERLLDQGEQVVVVDNFAVGSKDRLDHVAGHPDLDVVELDLRDGESTRKVVGEIEPRRVIHLAAHHFIPFCREHPADTIAVNVAGTQHLLDALVPIQPRCVVFASTADVYAPAPVAHVEHDPTQPDNIYGMSKLMAERLLEFHHQRAPETNVVSVRFFNAVGAGETNPHLVPDILDFVRLGDSLPIGNTGTRRDYIHTEDIAVALDRLSSELDGSFTVNLGTGASWDATDIVHFLSRLLGRNLTIDVDPAKVRTSDRPNLQASTRRLEMMLPGFRPKSLRQTLRHTLTAEGFNLPQTPEPVSRIGAMATILDTSCGN